MKIATLICCTIWCVGIAFGAGHGHVSKLCGLRFGDVVDVGNTRMGFKVSYWPEICPQICEGTSYTPVPSTVEFTPDSKFLDFDEYTVEVAPLSRKICGFRFLRDFKDESACSNLYLKNVAYLKSKMPTAKVSEDKNGKRACGCSFWLPGRYVSLYYVELHDKKFHLVFLFSDLVLSDQADKERDEMFRRMPYEKYSTEPSPVDVDSIFGISFGERIEGQFKDVATLTETERNLTAHGIHVDGMDHGYAINTYDKALNRHRNVPLSKIKSFCGMWPTRVNTHKQSGLISGIMAGENFNNEYVAKRTFAKLIRHLQMKVVKRSWLKNDDGTRWMLPFKTTKGEYASFEISICNPMKDLFQIYITLRCKQYENDDYIPKPIFSSWDIPAFPVSYLTPSIVNGVIVP